MRFFNNISNAILSHHILLRHYHVIQVHVQSPLTTDSLAYHNFDVFCSTISSDVEKKSVVVGVSWAKGDLNFSLKAFLAALCGALTWTHSLPLDKTIFSKVHIPSSCWQKNYFTWCKYTYVNICIDVWTKYIPITDMWTSTFQSVFICHRLAYVRSKVNLPVLQSSPLHPGLQLQLWVPAKVASHTPFLPHTGSPLLSIHTLSSRGQPSCELECLPTFPTYRSYSGNTFKKNRYRVISR